MTRLKKRKKIKVLFLFGFPLWGTGSAIYTTKLAEYLKRQTYEVAIVSPDGKNKIINCKRYYVKSTLRAVFQTHPEYKNARKYSEISSKSITDIYFAYLKSTIKAVEDFKPDIIHVQHASFLAWIANFIKALYGIDYIVTIHGTGLYNTTLDRRYYNLTRQALNDAGIIIAVSHHTKKWLFKVFGREFLRKTKVVTGGVDLSVYHDKKSTRVDIDSKYNLKDKNVIIYVGRITREKGIEYLIKAADRIKGEIFIIGGGSDKKRLLEFAKERNNIKFLGYFGKGYINELRSFYRRANVMVFPSVWDEPLGLVVLEAMACGTPVVASNKGGIPLAVKNNYSGYLIRAKSSSVIANKVNKLIENKSLQKKFSRNAKKIVKEKFDWNKIIDKIEPLYEKVCLSTEKLRSRRHAIFSEEDIRKEREDLQKKLGYF